MVRPFSSSEEEEEQEEATFSPSQLVHLAETHLRLRNFSLCRQYSLESQHPNHPHHHLRASQLIAISDILSAVSASSGPTNWYSVLQIDTFSADLTLIRSNFNNLLRLLENRRLPLADEALGFVSKAYGALSDPTRKAQLDSQLLSNQKHVSGEDFFWTFCPYCFYVYQYAKVYEGCCLRCQNETCRRAFHGVALCSLPKMELDKGEHFGSYGYFPMGFSPLDGKGGKGKFESWSPIVGLFPVGKPGKTHAGKIDLDVDNEIHENNNVHSVGAMDESDESEPLQHDYNHNNEHYEMNMDAPNAGIKPRMMRKKTVAWNAKRSTGRGRNNEGASDHGERSSGYGHEHETYGRFGDMHDVGMGSGGDLDADDVKFFEEDGEIFVGLSPDDAP